MPTIQELRTKREKLLIDARGILSADSPTTEQRVNAERMIADATALKSDIDNLSAIDTEMSSTSTRSKAGVQTEARSIEERREATNAALRTYLTRGASRADIDRRALTISADGSAIIPTGVSQPVVAAKSAGAVYDLVHKFKTQNGEPTSIPLWNDTANSWVLNSASVTTTDPSITNVTSNVDTIRRNPVLINNDLIQDTGFDLLSFVEQGFNQTYQLTLANWITNGNSSNVASILTSNTNTFTTATSGTVVYNDLLGVLGSVDPIYQIGAAWQFSNSSLATTILKIEDSNGRPLFLPFLDGGNSGFSGSIFGFPVKLNPYMPTAAAGHTFAQFGSFDAGYTLRECAPGIRIEQSTIPYMTSDQTVIVGFARVSGVFTDAGTHPLCNVVVHA